MAAPTIRRTTARVVPVNAWGETGLPVTPAELGEPFDRAEVTFPYDGAVFVNDATWFAVALEADAAALHTHAETEQILDYRWWRPDDLAADATVDNDRLPAFVRAAVAHVREAR